MLFFVCYGACGRDEEITQLFTCVRKLAKLSTNNSKKTQIHLLHLKTQSGVGLSPNKLLLRNQGPLLEWVRKLQRTTKCGHPQILLWMIKQEMWTYYTLNNIYAVLVQLIRTFFINLC